MQGQIQDVRIDPTASLTVRMVDEGGFYYVGKAFSGTAESDPKWHIFRMTKTIPIVILFPDGKTSFNKAWENRSTLNYQ